MEAYIEVYHTFWSRRRWSGRIHGGSRRKIQLAKGDVHQRSSGTASGNEVALVFYRLSRWRRNVQVLATVTRRSREILPGFTFCLLLSVTTGILSSHHDRQSVFTLVHQFLSFLQTHIVRRHAAYSGENVTRLYPRVLSRHFLHVEPATKDNPEI